MAPLQMLVFACALVTVALTLTDAFHFGTGPTRVTRARFALEATKCYKSPVLSRQTQLKPQQQQQQQQVPERRQEKRLLRTVLAQLLSFSIFLSGLGVVGTAPALAESNGPGFTFGSNVRLALEAIQENPESLTCNLDNQNIKGDQSSCQQLDAVVRLRAGHLITMKQDWGGSVSTGASVWNGENVAVWYMEHVLAPQSGLKGKRVIELGSGVGFSGVVASLQGASNVVITDGNEDVLRLADTNILNNVQNANQGAGSPKITTARLRWNTADEAVFVGEDGATQAWDLVLASDLTYLKKNWADLVHSIKALSGPTTRTILSMEPRNVGEVEGVLAELAKNGLRWEEAVLPPAIHGDLCDLSCPRLFVVTL